MTQNPNPGSNQASRPNDGQRTQESLGSSNGHRLAAVDVDASLLTNEPHGVWAKTVDLILDCFSSILVKEARQSLKSYQFFGTYIMLILAVVGWSVTVLALDVYGNRRSIGEDFASLLLCGYLIILGLPLLVIVPFSAFRSLMREYEDGTIQLISITTMRPYQIVIGKLATAMLQMAIYLAVVAPCIAFISMLDGVTYVQIVCGLGVVAYSCFILTVFGLLLAGASRSHGIGLATSTMFVLGLGGLYIGWWNFVTEVVGYANNFNNPNPSELWVVLYFPIAFTLCTTLIGLAAAASQISFPTDNRSTWIRVAIFLQLPFFLGGIAMIAPAFSNGFESILVLLVVFIGHYWVLMGGLLVGESGEISRRVLRSMPKSAFGKIFSSLFMPGPGRGYLFALACMSSCVAVVYIIDVNWEFFSIDAARDVFRNMPVSNRADNSLVSLAKAVIIVSYPCLFLSTTYLIMEMIRRFSRIRLSNAGGPILAMIISVTVFFMVTMSSIGLTDWSEVDMQYSTTDRTINDLACTWNWYLNIGFLVRARTAVDIASFLRENLLYGPLVLTSFAITLLGIIVASREFKHQPIATPNRVVEDMERERELAQQEQLVQGESINDIFGDAESDAESN